jgi:hypothetical protein
MYSFAVYSNCIVIKNGKKLVFKIFKISIYFSYNFEILMKNLNVSQGCLDSFGKTFGILKKKIKTL